MILPILLFPSLARQQPQSVAREAQELAGFSCLFGLFG
jgi:hypothetical protein